MRYRLFTLALLWLFATTAQVAHAQKNNLFNLYNNTDVIGGIITKLSDKMINDPIFIERWAKNVNCWEWNKLQNDFDRRDHLAKLKIELAEKGKNVQTKVGKGLEYALTNYNFERNSFQLALDPQVLNRLVAWGTLDRMLVSCWSAPATGVSTNFPKYVFLDFDYKVLPTEFTVPPEEARTWYKGAQGPSAYLEFNIDVQSWSIAAPDSPVWLFKGPVLDWTLKIMSAVDGKVVRTYNSKDHPPPKQEVKTYREGETVYGKPQARTAERQDRPFERNAGRSDLCCASRMVTATVNVRENPDVQSELVAALQPGTCMEVTGTSGDWISIVLSGNLKGWMHAPAARKSTKNYICPAFRD